MSKPYLVRFLFAAIALLVLLNYAFAPHRAHGQRSNTNTNTNSGNSNTGRNSNTGISNSPNSTRRSETNAQPTPGGTPAARSTKPGTTQPGNRGTTGTAARPPGGPGARARSAAPGKGDGGMLQAGQIKQVTRQMVQEMRTTKIDYVEEEYAKRPNVVILGTPQFGGGQSRLERLREDAKPTPQ